MLTANTPGATGSGAGDSGAGGQANGHSKIGANMIAHLRGQTDYKQPGQAIVEAGGVGYDVTISVPTFTALPSTGAEPRCTFTPR